MRKGAVGLSAVAVLAGACVLDFDKFEAPPTPGVTVGTTTSTTGGMGGMMVGSGPTTTSSTGGGGVPACENGMIEGSESDVDCGGAVCPPCSNGSSCKAATDCVSNLCSAGFRAPCGPTDCEESQFCDRGVCLDDKPLGETCADAGECTSGFCVDGVCCDGLCDGFCEGCDVGLTAQPAGTCAPLIAGTDPDAECMDLTDTQVCDGGASCVPLCGLAPMPIGAMCPSICNGGCDGGTCNIVCTNQNDCGGDTIVCPPGFACQVACSFNNSCAGATVECPEGYPCGVSCQANSTCANLTVSCASGECDLTCGNSNASCSGATLDCGPNTCAATCAGASEPTVNCNTSCSCTPCP